MTPRRPDRFGSDVLSRTQLRPVGSLDLLDLKVLSEFYGASSLPYPLMLTEPMPFATADDASAHAAEVMEQFSIGDLSLYAEYVATYAAADIRVEFHVQYIPADTPSVRVVAHRTGSLGFLAEQRADADIIDIYALSPYDLSAAVCDMVPFTQPGAHPKIVVPDYAPLPQAAFDTGDFVVQHHREAPAEITIPAADVSAYATVQSHFLPRRKWGRDREKEALVWIQVQDDGDYIYVADMSSAKPMTRPELHKRIDLLIAHDVAILRELRRTQFD